MNKKIFTNTTWLEIEDITMPWKDWETYKIKNNEKELVFEIGRSAIVRLNNNNLINLNKVFDNFKKEVSITSENIEWFLNQYSKNN